MNINRNNYEEYFLLYTDKELSAEERDMVEMFVRQNPDLEEEFVMLQQLIVQPDKMVALESKNFLFAKETFINQNNYQEIFLLYMDNELSKAEADETDKFVVSNPSLQNELSLLKAIQYEPDSSIVFPGKKYLYKKQSEGRVIPFRWKAMAAAVLLGIGLWVTVYLQQNKSSNVVTKNGGAPKNNQARSLQEKSSKKYIPAKNEVHEKTSTVDMQMDLVSKYSKQQNTVRDTRLTDNREVNNKIASVKEEDIAVNNKVHNAELIKTNELPQPINMVTEQIDNTITTQPVTVRNNYALTASYIADAEIKSENYVFYNITAEEFKKSKVGHFLKKIKRAIARKNPLKNNFKEDNVSTDQ